MSSIKCRKGCNVNMVSVSFNLISATDVPAWACSLCGTWNYSEQARYLYRNQLYGDTTTKYTYEDKVNEFLRE